MERFNRMLQAAQGMGMTNTAPGAVSLTSPGCVTFHLVLLAFICFLGIDMSERLAVFESTYIP